METAFLDAKRDDIVAGPMALESYEFEIWQRKNNSTMEAFTTRLFVRRTNEEWQFFLLDHEDHYRPSITVSIEGSNFVLRSS